MSDESDDVEYVHSGFRTGDLLVMIVELASTVALLTKATGQLSIGARDDAAASSLEAGEKVDQILAKIRTTLEQAALDHVP